MNVAPIKAEKGMSFDTIVGVLYYGFSNYSVLPRNDDDFIGASISLPATDYPKIVSVRNITYNRNLISFFPNPAQNTITLKTNDNNIQTVAITISDLSGKLIQTGSVQNGRSLDVSNLAPGVYLVRGTSENTELGAFRLIKE